MVYKVCKGGVRSGNTLRGLNTRNSYRYSRHACLIGKSSMSNRDVTKMVQTSTDDDMIAETVQSTDVIMSLNKKQRWLLPSVMRHMIRTGYFGSAAMVSLLERHKLKRRANCVSFVSNKGKTTCVQPKQKRYFSYSLKNIDEDQSKREKRRLKSQAQRKIKQPKLVKGRGDKVKTIQAFTVAGVDPTTDDDLKNIIPSTKPEYRMEIFYPCPKTCSLAFNPKYTDVTIEENESGEQEVKAVKNQGQSKASRRHRKRLTTSAWTNLEGDDVEDDVNEMWEDCSSDVEGHDSSVTTELDNKNNVYENMWSKLIEEAENAKSLCYQKPYNPRKKTNRVVSTTSFDSNMLKPHIVYVADNDEFRGNAILSTQKEVLEDTNQISEFVDMASFRIIASSNEVIPEELRNKFGHRYSEADCKPRRFIINVTDDVINTFSASKSINQGLAFTSFIVFTYDGLYDDGFDAYKVTFNSYICKKIGALLINIPFQKYSLDQVINHVFESLLDTKSEKILDVSLDNNVKTTTDQFQEFLNFQLKLDIETFHTDQAIRNLNINESNQNLDTFSERLGQFVLTEDFDSFCQICYECVTPSNADSLPGTSMTKCDHTFCDECWRSHIRTKMADGALKISCPAYECDVSVDPVALISLVHATEVGTLLQRRKEEEVETSEHAKWCPNPSCGCVIKMKVNKISPDMSYDVTCACGSKICFACLQDAHWPARCDQADFYSDRFVDIALPIEIEDSDKKTPSYSHVKSANLSKKKPKPISVEGKLCPKCKRFIEKNGGCPQMSCRCGGMFCWTCLAPINYQTGHGSCKPNHSYVTEMSRTVVIRHITPQITARSLDAPARAEQEVVDKDKDRPGRQRVSLYQRAKQQRQEGQQRKSARTMDILANRIAAQASKDQDFKDEILELCAQHTGPQSKDQGHSLSSTKKQVAKFLESCELSRRALHHVTEFTFVLLQDLPQSQDKRRALALANDLSGYCSFSRSILEASTGDQQPPRTAVRRLVDIQVWARRAVTALVKTVNRLKAADRISSLDKEMAAF